VFAGWGVLGVVAATVLRQVYIAVFLAVRGGLRDALTGGALPAGGRLLEVSVPLGVAALVTQLYYGADGVLIGFMLPSRELGYYSAALKLVGLGISLKILVGSVLYPRVARLSAESARTELSGLSERVSAMSTTIGVGAAILLFGVAGPIVRILYGGQYEPAIVPFCIAIWVLALEYANFSNAYVLTVNSRRWYLAVMVVAAVVGIGANIALLRTFGIVGAALVYVATSAIVLVAMHAVMARQKRIATHRYALTALAAAAAGCATALLVPGDLARAVCAIAILCAVTYPLWPGVRELAGLARGWPGARGGTTDGA
jgi:O-antigen/teichoic acid export membrane protein